MRKKMKKVTKVKNNVKKRIDFWVRNHILFFY